MFDRRAVGPGPESGARTAPARRTPTKAHLLELQSLVGNRAVQRMFAPGPVTVQRGDPPSTDTKASFTTQEWIWIDDVLEHPFIDMMFKVYGGRQDILLKRVRSLGGQTEGQSEGNLISIADASYEQKETFRGPDGKPVAATSEEEFKSTFIHELFHFFEGRTTGVLDAAKVATPEKLMDIVLHPHAYGMKHAAFGWFLHPTSNVYLHLDHDLVGNMLNPDAYVDPDTPLGQLRKRHDYESSPMSQSGHSISVEEDLATTLALFLTSDASRATLRADFPLRFKLMIRFFEKALPKSFEDQGK